LTPVAARRAPPAERGPGRFHYENLGQHNNAKGPLPRKSDGPDSRTARTTTVARPANRRQVARSRAADESATLPRLKAEYWQIAFWAGSASASATPKGSSSIFSTCCSTPEEKNSTCAISRASADEYWFSAERLPAAKNEGRRPLPPKRDACRATLMRFSMAARPRREYKSAPARGSRPSSTRRPRLRAISRERERDPGRKIDRHHGPSFRGGLRAANRRWLRKLNDPMEKVRKAVTNRIPRLDRADREDAFSVRPPTWWNSIRTGFYCSYLPGASRSSGKS